MRALSRAAPRRSDIFSILRERAARVTSATINSSIPLRFIVCSHLSGRVRCTCTSGKNITVTGGGAQEIHKERAIRVKREKLQNTENDVTSPIRLRWPFCAVSKLEITSSRGTVLLGEPILRCHCRRSMAVGYMIWETTRRKIEWTEKMKFTLSTFNFHSTI